MDEGRWMREGGGVLVCSRVWVVVQQDIKLLLAMR